MFQVHLRVNFLVQKSIKHQVARMSQRHMEDQRSRLIPAIWCSTQMSIEPDRSRIALPLRSRRFSSNNEKQHRADCRASHSSQPKGGGERTEGKHINSHVQIFTCWGREKGEKLSFYLLQKFVSLPLLLSPPSSLALSPEALKMNMIYLLLNTL